MVEDPKRWLEHELKEWMGHPSYDEVRAIIEKARADKKSPDEIKALVKTYLEANPFYIWNLIGNLQMYVAPPR